MLRGNPHALRAFGPVTFAAALLANFFGTGGCIRAVSGEAVPTEARLYYPSRMALSPDGRSAYVVNTNFDQRFASSWLTKVDVPALVASTDSATALAALSQGPHVASLGGPLLIDEARSRAYLTHRGLGLLTTLDIDAAPSPQALDTWHCDGRSREGLSNREKKTDCDAAHILELHAAAAAAVGLSDDPDRDQFLDPFAMVQDSNGTLAVAFLGTNRVARLSTTLPLTVQDVLSGAENSSIDDLALLTGSQLMGAGRSHAGSVFARPESVLMGWTDGAVAASVFSPSRAMGQAPNLLERAPEVVRLLAAPGDGTRVFLLGRRPDTVSIAQVVSVPQSSNKDGAVVISRPPGQVRIVHTEVLGDQALNELAYLTRPTGNLLVASSFVRDTLYFFADLGDRLHEVQRLHLPAGRGPAAMLPVTVDGASYLLVTTFFDHGLDLVDVSSPNVADFRLHARVFDATFKQTNRAR